VYGMIDDEARLDIMRWLGERQYIWMDDRDLSAEIGWRPDFAVEIGRARTQFLYSNAIESPGYVRKRSTIKDPRYPLAQACREGSECKVVKVPGDVFAFYRENYLAKSIAPAPPMWCYLVVVDGGVIGAFGLQEPRWGDKDGVYMLSDFAIGNAPHRRASKLVVMVALSETVRAQVERMRLMATRTLTTTAFTKRPVSMKYRGLLNVVKRGEGFLNVAGEFRSWTAQGAYEEWWRRYGRDQGGVDAERGDLGAGVGADGVRS
jgi:hypothetical protein